MSKLYLEVRDGGLKSPHWKRVFESWEKSTILEKFWGWQPFYLDRRIVDEDGLVWVMSKGKLTRGCEGLTEFLKRKESET